MIHRLIDYLFIFIFLCCAFLLGAFLQWQDDQQWATSVMLSTPDTQSMRAENGK